MEQVKLRDTISDTLKKHQSGYLGLDLIVAESAIAEAENRAPDFGQVFIDYLSQYNLDVGEWGGLMWLAEDLIHRREATGS